MAKTSKTNEDQATEKQSSPVPAHTNDPPTAPEQSTGQIVSSRLIHSKSSLSISMGPLPPPDALKDYDAIVPGAADRILQMAEQQLQHRRHLEQTVIHSDVWRSYFGIAAGFLISLVCVIGGIIVVNNGHDAAGAAIATTPVVGLAGVFVYGAVSRQRERHEKTQMLAGTKDGREKH